MKILLHSNSPRSGTGYGVQIAMIATQLAADGHDIAVSCTHGHDAGMGVWKSPKGDEIRLYPRRFSPTGDDILHGHANHFFEGDLDAGWVIPLIDVWALRSPYLAEYNMAAWAPVDHVDVPPGVLGFFDDTKAVPLAMSRHGETGYLRHGLDPTYIPLAVDTSVFKPTFEVVINGEAIGSRDLLNIPRNAFVVGVVAMNKGNAFDRKGFSEIMYSFGKFHANHPNAVLYMHTDKMGAEGIHLMALAADAGVPQSALIFSDQYAYTIGFSSEMMAALYTSFDVLLSPSHGEGACVPLLESQACGTPVIASNATAQPEHVGIGSGWLVAGQRTWDPSQHSPAFIPFVADIVDALETAYDSDLEAMQPAAIEFAGFFDIERVYDKYWRPFLASLEPTIPADDKPEMSDVAVVIPVMKRPGNVARVVESFNASNDGTATLYFVADPDDDAEIDEIRKHDLEPLISDRGHTFAQKANYAYEHTDESFLFLCGDDVEFTSGWLEAARALSTRWDVIGTNDAEEGRVRNPDVAAGRHTDHWFTRRSYIDEEGSSLEGPGEFCPEAYYHWWVDREIIELAKARHVFSPCLESRVIHHHPGFDGDEQARADDETYMKAVEWAERDRTSFMRRVALIEQHRNDNKVR